LDRGALLEAITRSAGEDHRLAESLRAYADAMIGDRHSSLSAVRADIAPAATEIERTLDEGVAKLGSAGGLAAIAGVLFAVELLNQEHLLADAAWDIPRKALSSCLQAFAQDDSTVDLLAASVHFALDLVATLSDHQPVIDEGLRGTMDRSAECGDAGSALIAPVYRDGR
jgi:hypothetical protein